MKLRTSLVQLVDFHLGGLTEPRRHTFRNRRGTPGARGPFQLTAYHLIWIFVITSVVGLVAETLVSIPVDGEWRSRPGLIWGPFSPIYGVGFVLITVLLNPISGSGSHVLFGVSALAGGAFEYFAGWFWETAFGIVAWSYAGDPFNIGDHTCLGMMCVWGLIGLAWMRGGLPPLLRWLDSFTGAWRRRLTRAMACFLVADIAMTFVAIDCWYLRQAGNPVSTPIERLCAQRYDDDFMSSRFAVMAMHPQLARRS